LIELAEVTRRRLRNSASAKSSFTSR